MYRELSKSLTQGTERRHESGDRSTRLVGAMIIDQSQSDRVLTITSIGSHVAGIPREERI